MAEDAQPPPPDGARARTHTRAQEALALLRKPAAPSALAGLDREEQRERLSAFVETIAHMALTEERTYTNKSGESKVVPMPEYKAALEAARLLAQLHGLLGDDEESAKRVPPIVIEVGDGKSATPFSDEIRSRRAARLAEVDPVVESAASNG